MDRKTGLAFLTFAILFVLLFPYTYDVLLNLDVSSWSSLHQNTEQILKAFPIIMITVIVGVTAYYIIKRSI